MIIFFFFLIGRSNGLNFDMALNKSLRKVYQIQVKAQMEQAIKGHHFQFSNQI